jgi:peptidoglycan/LPS O-acetylase OafA/YrhL
MSTSFTSQDLARFRPHRVKRASARAPSDRETTPGTVVGNNLDYLMVMRLFACGLVVLVHSWLLVPQAIRDDDVRSRSFLTLFGFSAKWLLRGNGQIGVCMFFTLSGYLMGKAFYSRRYLLDAKGISAFLWNRYVRITPLYLIV